MNRDLDADICREIFGWKLAHVGKDYNGENECEILTQNGAFPEGYDLPRVGKIHVAFLCPQYSGQWDTAIALARRVGLVNQDWPVTPEHLAQSCLEFWRKGQNSCTLTVHSGTTEVNVTKKTKDLEASPEV